MKVNAPLSAKHYNWKKFQSSLDTQIATTNLTFGSREEVDEGILNFTSIIHSALASAQKVNENKVLYKPLPAYIRAVITQKNKIRKTFQRTCHPPLKSEYNRLTKQVAQLTKQFRNSQWLDAIEALESDTSSLLRALKKSFKKNATSDCQWGGCPFRR